jgi:hypothetical protein
MKLILTITSILAIIIGFSAIIESLPSEEYYANTAGIVGGVMFMVQGILPLIYINIKK